MYGDLPLIETQTDPEGKSKQVPGFPVQIQNPKKTCVLRLPTPPELVKYLNAKKSIVVNLPGGATESIDPETPREDEELFNLIRLDKSGEPFDEAEIAFSLDRITTIRIDEVEREGDNFSIVLSTVGGRTTHTVSMPRHIDQAEYRRTVFRSKQLPGGKTEQRVPIEAPMKLYDKIKVSVEGYSSGTDIPPHHKRAVINVVMRELSELDSVLDPN